MKTFKVVLSLMVIAMSVMVCNPAMAQSRKDKKAAKKAQWEFEQKKLEMERQRALDSIANLNKAPEESFIEIPCYEKSRSDANFYRELGIGQDLSKSNARVKAISNANKMMNNRLGGVVKGLATDYTRTDQKTGKQDDIEGIMESEFTKVVDEVLKNADNPCEKMSQDKTGNYNSYYVIEIEKNTLVDKLTEAVSNNDKLKTEVDREKFRKYAREYMQNQGE